MHSSPDWKAQGEGQRKGGTKGRQPLWTREGCAAARQLLAVVALLFVLVNGTQAFGVWLTGGFSIHPTLAGSPSSTPRWVEP
jgi:hypothetical protein